MGALGARATAAVLAVLLASAASSADDAAAARERFRKEMASIYDYSPREVSEEVRTAKAAEMDRLWELVASDLDAYLPPLREALRDEKANAFFLFDGSALLAKHARDAADWQLAADATARCRLGDVSRKGYFHFCHHLAANGADAVAATLKMLEDPEFVVFVPMHALKLPQSDCVRLALLAIGEERWVPPVIRRLSAEKDATARATLLRCLADAVTPEADTALKALAEDPKSAEADRNAAKSLLRCSVPLPRSKEQPSIAREEFAARLARADEAGRLPVDAMRLSSQRDARLLVLPEDETVLRSLRRKTARRVSDEALGEIEFLTELLRRVTVSPK